ncbi:DUF2314 domain-containing protein [uncultured Erythrobacter sp.]|uniref:DUF2314 domain-containing protein n=1 Tax=uncultured Erythrobacter sp. TaxID=263913 RepID=UPI002608A097|nr:DUF2314 domain-containing protein [uncultured Erythrobacter sp.]
MTFRPTLLALSLALTAAPLAPAFAQAADEPDPIVELPTDDAEMNAAKDEARATIDEWLDVLIDPPFGTRDIAFKFPLDGWEHIWVDNVRLDGEFLEGQLANSPHSDGYQYRDFVRVSIYDVSDWSYRDTDGVMHGHRTTRVLFPELEPELVAQIKADFGWE